MNKEEQKRMLEDIVPDGLASFAEELRELGHELYTPPTIVRLAGQAGRGDIRTEWKAKAAPVISALPTAELRREAEDLSRLGYLTLYVPVFSDVKGPQGDGVISLVDEGWEDGVPPVECLYPAYPHLFAYVSTAFVSGCRSAEDLRAFDIEKVAPLAEWEVGAIAEMMDGMAAEMMDPARRKEVTEATEAGFPRWGAQPEPIAGWEPYKERLMETAYGQRSVR